MTLSEYLKQAKEMADQYDMGVITKQEVVNRMVELAMDFSEKFTG